MDVDGDWEEDSQISDCLRTKILSLKLCRHRCITQSKSESPMDVASPVFKMLTTLLQRDGLLSDRITTRYFSAISLRHLVVIPEFSASERSRLRLQAAVSMAYLSAIDTYAQVTAPHFVLLALTIQVTLPSCTTPSPTLTQPAGCVFPRPFPFLNEDHPSPAHSSTPLPVQRDSFLDSI